MLLLKNYNFEIKYKAKTLNSTNASSRRSNYENEQLNDICLLILQKTLRNIVIVNINFDVENERFKFEKLSNDELKNDDSQMMNDAKKQTMRRKEARDICENEFF